MIYIYTVFDYYDYVCTHQRMIGKVIKGDADLFDVQVLSPLTVKDTCDRLKEKHSNTVLVWDLRRMSLDNAGRQLIDILIPIKEKTYSGICFLIDTKDSEIFDRIHKTVENFCKEEDDKYESCVLNESCCYCGEKGVFVKTLKDHVDDQCISTVVDNDINHYTFEYLKTNGDRQWKQNPSSNIYVNQYFDAKKMLTNGSIYNLIIYRMALLVNNSLNLFYPDDKQGNHESEREFDAFVCASLTGSCLASGLSAIFHKPIIYLKNIGPSITANDERLIARIEKNKRYVYVFDFMCLGKEYERMKLICNLRSAKIICCSGISYYRLPRFKEVESKEGENVFLCFDWNKELCISFLFQVNAFDEDYYSCRVSE